MVEAYPTGDPTGFYELDPSTFDFCDIADTSGIGAPDGKLDIGDLNLMLFHMVAAYPTGDPTGLYTISCF